jgi:hypothetical protein
MNRPIEPTELLSKLQDRQRSRIITWALFPLVIALLGLTTYIKDYRIKATIFGSNLILITVGNSQNKLYRRLSKELNDFSEVAEQKAIDRVALQMSPSSPAIINIGNLNEWKPDDLITETDLIKMLQLRHGRIIGNTGDGKSVLAKYLVRLLDVQKVKCYDIEATAKDWIGFDVFGRGENYDDIANQMKLDLSIFKERVQWATDDENDQGWDSFKGNTLIRICEEYPDVRTEINKRYEAEGYEGLADEWNERHARRGRKPGLLLILISQYDTNAAWGFEGKGSLKNCYHAIRLGEFALDEAKRIGGIELRDWIKADIKSRCMVDSKPCQLPNRSMMIQLGQGINNPKKDTDINILSSPEGNESLNEYERAILEYGKKNTGIILKARDLQIGNSLLKKLAAEDIRIIFQSLADKDIGEVITEGRTLGWIYNIPST